MACKNPKITLLPAEQLLRDFLLDCADHFPGLEIWIAGGWVRDRLLGIPSSDMDLALNNLTGRQFGEFLQTYSAQPEFEAKYREKATALETPASKLEKLTIIERNADMAKQLETASGSLFGLDFDPVNLRKEVYSDHSRTPEMEFGTPEDDALRRDATVNALFYDLKMQEVVDFTGKGLGDLDALIMRTPLDPRRIFLDDALRVLRMLRIGSRLGFSIDPGVLEAMKQNEIRRALDTIVTRDRINMELTKMMKDSHPEVAFRYIFESNLFSPIFIRLESPLLENLKTEFPGYAQPPWPAPWPRACSLLAPLLQVNAI